MKDHYATLGVADSATEKEIKTSYRKLASKFHPDKNDSTEATSKFQEISEAYETLSDTQKKSEYDYMKANGGQPRGNFGFAGAGPGSGSVDMSDIFSSMFGNQRRQQQQRTPIYELRLSLLQAYTGTTVDMDGQHVKIPAGVQTGNRMHIDNKMISISVLPHPKFKRAFNDLLVDIDINVFAAMLGIDAIVTNIDSAKLKFKIPPGTQQGQVIKLSKKGMPFLDSDNKGDLLIRCNIIIPDLTGKENERIIDMYSRKTINI